MSPKEQWVTAVEKHETAREAKRIREETSSNEYWQQKGLAAKEIRDFLSGEGGIAAQNLLKTTRVCEVGLGEGDDDDDRAIFLVLNPDGFHFSWDTKAREEERKARKETILDVSIWDAINDIVQFNGLGGPRDVLPFITSRLDRLAEKLTKCLPA